MYKFTCVIFDTSCTIKIFSQAGPKPLPKRALNIVKSGAPSFKWQHPLLSLRSYISFLRLLPCLPAISISPFIFPPITCCRRQCLRKIWPIQLAFRLLISCEVSICSLTVSNTSSFLTWSIQMIFSILLQHHISKLSRCFWSTKQYYVRFIPKYSFGNTYYVFN